jgi:hypothetical protein
LMAGHGTHAAVANQSNWFAADADTRSARVDNLPAMRGWISDPDYVCHGFFLIEGRLQMDESTSLADPIVLPFHHR